ncbi:hypothetical protein [Microbacterium sp. NPDC057650]|uniref:hypothetical protein n=1 Tax=unclassified Microbacterium TaxID=2609290 RepID=UPI003670FA3F
MTGAGLRLDIQVRSDAVRARCEQMLAQLRQAFPGLNDEQVVLSVSIQADPSAPGAQGLLRGSDIDHVPAGGYAISVTTEPTRGVAWVVADGDAVVEAAAAALLSEFGFGFSLAGDVAPDPAAELLGLSAVRTVAPRFMTRGTQLWCFWLPGRDVWGLQEYKKYLDQFPKLGLNLLDIPLYLYEPLYTGYDIGGVSADQIHLAGRDLSAVRVGAEVMAGAPERFVSRDIPLHASGAERAQNAQELMRRVIEHAHSLGVKTCFGIEPANALDFGQEARSIMPESDLYEHGRLVQPSSPSARALLRSKLSALFKAYPDCDYYGLWQSEAGIWRANSGSPHPDDAAFREALQAKDPSAEPSDADYLRWLQLADELAAELKPDARFVTNGWGCEAIFRCADEVLSDRFIRSSIAKYEPRMTVDGDRLASYAATDGETWNVTWAETDQHMQVVQPKFEATRAVIDRLEELGASGLQTLHWTTVQAQINLDFITSQMWNPRPSIDEFLLDWASRRFGEAAAPSVADAFRALEDLNELTVKADPTMWSWPGLECGLTPALGAHRFIRSDAGFPERWMELSRGPLAEHQQEMLRLAACAAGTLRDALARGGTSRSQYQELERLAELFTYVEVHYAAHFQVLDAAHAWHTEATSSTPTREGFLAALALIDGELPVQAIEHLVASLGPGVGDPDIGQLGMVLTLNEKLLGGTARLMGSMRRAIDGDPGITGTHSDETVIAAWPGVNIPEVQFDPEYGTWDVTPPQRGVHVPAHDRISVAPGWALNVGEQNESIRQTGELGSWRHSQRIELGVSGPIGSRARVRLYFWEDSGWNSLFRRVLVRINGEVVATAIDFLGHGEDQSDGVWIEHEIDLVDGAADISLERVGNADVQVSGIVVDAR